MSQETDLPIRLVCISIKNTVPSLLKASKSAGGGGVVISLSSCGFLDSNATRVQVYMFTMYTFTCIHICAHKRTHTSIATFTYKHKDYMFVVKKIILQHFYCNHLFYLDLQINDTNNNHKYYYFVSLQYNNLPGKLSFLRTFCKDWFSRSSCAILSLNFCIDIWSFCLSLS